MAAQLPRCRQPASNAIHIADDPSWLGTRITQFEQNGYKKITAATFPSSRAPKTGAVRLRTNDYLCLAKHPHIINAEVQTLQAYGHGEAVSRVFEHNAVNEIRDFEQRLARLMRAEDAVVCCSGYMANVGLIQAVADPLTPVYLDMFAHESIHEGVRSAGATAHIFRHQDTSLLESLVRRFGPGLVCVDALHSTSGTIAPLADITNVTERLGCALLVDETHSFGAQGPDGAGLVVEAGLQDRVHFRTVGLSKAAASRGGAVVCSARHTDRFRYEARPAIFSTSVHLHEAAGYCAMLDVLKHEPWRREKLTENHAVLKEGLSELGYNVDASDAQIISLEAGNEDNVWRLRDALERNGVFGSLFTAPAVPKTRNVMRLTVNCGLSEEDMRHVLDVCSSIRDEVGMAQWPSTLRRARNRHARSSAESVLTTTP